MNDNNKKFWDRFARFYGLFMKKQGKEYDEICRTTSSYLDKKNNVLELACGSGQLSYPLAEYAGKYIATDFSEEMIDRAKKENKKENLYFAVQDATALEYNDGEFDAVVISNALHIVPEPEKVMNEIKRVLKTGGTLIASTFVWREEEKKSVKIWFLQKLGFRIFSNWSAKEYLEFLEKQGFETISSKLIGRSLTPICCAIMKKTI